MTPESILLKLTKRSTPATAAFDVWLATNYSLADLTHDLMKLAMQDDRTEQAYANATANLRISVGDKLDD